MPLAGKAEDQMDYVLRALISGECDTITPVEYFLCSADGMSEPARIGAVQFLSSEFRKGRYESLTPTAMLRALERLDSLLKMEDRIVMTPPELIVTCKADVLWTKYLLCPDESRPVN